MSLRRQLLLVSLLLLTLPWAGCQFIREMEGALRQGQSQALQATAEAVAAVLAANERHLYPQPLRRQEAIDEHLAIYAYPSAAPVIIDGYGDGWNEVPGRGFGDSSAESSLYIRVRAQTRGQYLYLLFDVSDDKVIYHNPGLSPDANGDRLVLRLWADNRRHDYVVATAAPGSVRARYDGRRRRGVDPGRINGYWQDAMSGYSLELELPLEYTGGRLGFFFIDEDSTSPRGDRSAGNITRLEATPPPWLIYQPRELQALLGAFSGGGKHIQVVDRSRWLLSDLHAGRPEENTAETFWLLRLLYRSILDSDELPPPPRPDTSGKLAGEEVDDALAGSAGSRRYGDPDSGSRTILSHAAPIADDRGVMGAVVVRQSGETYLSLTDKAFSRLLGYSLLALAIGALALLAYATVLSLRVRRLSRAITHAVSEDGRVSGSFTPSRARDEIGDLSRQYNELLGRLKEYNDYLHTLSRKLAHELRTPIAVIQSSLDNLEQAGDNRAASAYLPRAREGLGRLQYILTAMSEASRLEESVRSHEKQRVDLVPLLRELTGAYREVYADHKVTFTAEAASAPVEGVAELLVQALDKLMDNAASFAPPGSIIELQLVEAENDWKLRVHNEGPPLPAGMAEKLFEPMVSEREAAGESVHLGLGLHIVRLIVDFHGGNVVAENLEGGYGVAVTISLPTIIAA